MLLTLYQQSEVFAASRLTSFGDGPFLLTVNSRPRVFQASQLLSQRTLQRLISASAFAEEHWKVLTQKDREKTDLKDREKTDISDKAGSPFTSYTHPQMSAKLPERNCTDLSISGVQVWRRESACCRRKTEIS